MEKTLITLELKHEGKQYTGFATPADTEHPNGLQGNYHIVLNEKPFGEMSFRDNRWINSEQQPEDLVAATGKALAAALEIKDAGIKTDDQG